MKKLTIAAGKVLVELNQFHERNEIMPTRAELADIMGYGSANSIHLHFLYLEKEGFIRLMNSISRGIVITREGKKIRTQSDLKTHIRHFNDN